jgi:NADH-quinone oxidoreductase subunit J
VAETLFYLAGLMTLGCALGVVLARNPMTSVLALLGSFFGLAVVYLLIGFQFMAAVQLVVYAGAILVLFLFVIMLLGVGAPDPAPILRGRRAALAGLLAAAALVAGLVTGARAVTAPVFALSEFPDGIDALPELAAMLFGRYGLAFEATGVLLLATMVGVIALAKRQRRSGAIGAPRAPGDAGGGA